MAHSASTSKQFVALAQSFKRLTTSDPLTPCLAPRIAQRTYATIQPQSSIIETKSETITATPTVSTPIAAPVLTTLYSWPSITPTSFTTYPPELLSLPLRRDILHRAVIHDGDRKRAGTASTKWRSEVRGSGAKLRPQKGSGRARLSDKKNPMLRGGGVAHGPKPRDMSTDIQKKVYDKAVRTALSYRYKKGELVILDGTLAVPEDAGPRFLHNVFSSMGWGQGCGRSLVLTLSRDRSLWDKAADVGEHLDLRTVESGWTDVLAEEDMQDDEVKMVDVKALLETGRVVIEKAMLERLFKEHSSDLARVHEKQPVTLAELQV